MKIAKNVPIYKAKDKTDMGNYRPISLLLTVSKILEKAVHHRLYSYCKAENILYADQYGFQPQRSTIDAIAKFTSNVALSTENKDTTMAVFLDLSKAFDTIDHNILHDKLTYYGIRGLALEWFSIVNRTELDICITQREIYRMLIIMLIMRQKDLSCVYM